MRQTAEPRLFALVQPSKGAGGRMLLDGVDPTRSLALIMHTLYNARIVVVIRSWRWKRWYEEMIPVADQLYDDYLAELRREGELK
jgi:hypothetical protein